MDEKQYVSSAAGFAEQIYYSPQVSTCTIQSYAKINLTLDVLGKREDGYHELSTIMQTIDLYDTLYFTFHPSEVHIHCTLPELSTEENLVVKAVYALRQRCNIPYGVTIELQKRIPVAAGMGGGSSNAASTLLALQQWWRLPLTHADLCGIASTLGSDVPFFLTGGLALCEGRGERITSFPASWPASQGWLLILKPQISVSTAHIYKTLRDQDYTNGEHSQAILHALIGTLPLPMYHLHNGLTRTVLAQYPEVVRAQHDLYQAGASLVCLSGSGPTLFAPFAELTSALQVQHHLEALGHEVYLTRPVYAHATPMIFATTYETSYIARLDRQTP